jgi:hypothetical protein
MIRQTRRPTCLLSQELAETKVVHGPWPDDRQPESETGSPSGWRVSCPFGLSEEAG